MAEAYIKLHRNMLEWEWYDNQNTKDLFIHCLLKANWKPTKWHGIEIEAGQFVTSLPTLADELHFTIQQVRTAMSHLKSTGEITDYQQGKYRVVTVNNWVRYQQNNRQSNRQSTGCQQDVNRQSTADKEYKEYKKGEEVKNINTPYNPPRYFPNDETLDQAFTDYVDMRKKIKKPMTHRAVDLAIKKLNELSGGDNDLAVRIINQSIMNSWQGLFPLKEDHKQNQTIDWSKV